MGKPLCVLIVEDSPDDAALLVRELRRNGYDPTFERVDTAQAMTAALDKQNWDVIICDYNLPNFSAPAALELLQKSGRDLPFIIVSGTISEEVAVAAMKSGAHDFIMKSNLARLVPAVEREMGESDVRRERRQAEEALRASEANFKRLLEYAPDAVVIASDGGNAITFINRQAEKLFGYRPDELLGHPVEILVPERLREGHVQKRMNFTHALPPRPMSARPGLVGRRKDGSEFSADIMLGPVEMNGEVSVLAIVRDITERKQAEEALKLFRTLIDRSNDAIEVVDPETGRFLDINEKAWRDLGCSREELLSLSVFDIDPTVTPSSFPMIMEKLRKSGFLIWEGYHRRKDGSTFPVEVNIKYVRLDRDYAVTVVRDITERKKSEETIQHIASHDTLTGLPNRTTLYNHLLDAIRTDAGEGKPLALLLMDLDRFKEINDTLGHERGDEILKQVSRRLREAMFEHDIVARPGGDEFSVLLLKMANAKDIDVVIQKILKALDLPFMIEGLPIRIEASIGIALYPAHAQAAEGLFRRADIAMHSSKKSGIPSTVYDPVQDKHSPQRLALMGELHHAIEHDELVLFYQPKISLKTRCTIGVEALVRWKHPLRGMIPPDQFILPAEQTGLIHPLTQWVIAAGMRQCKAWRETGTALTVSVNLSARNLLDPKLPGLVADQLKSAGVAPDWMIFEITESAIMADPAHALDVLMRLHEMGLRFSIDDFGTGYSSLAYLKKLPVDSIKIDKSFVINMSKSESDAVIVRLTIDLAHNLGLKVVAEGVENQDLWDRLAVLGCDEAQGYHMGRPMPAEELSRWLSESPWGMKRA